MKKFLVLIFLFAAFCAAAVAWYAYNEYQSALETPLTLPASGMTYEVASGTNLKALARDLETKGILSKAIFLELYARETGQAAKIKAGEYFLQQGLDPKSLMALLVRGKTVQHRFSIIEGTRYQDALKVIASQSDVVHSIDAKNFVAFFEELTGETHPEGWLFPDTYHHPKNIDDVELILNAYEMTKATLEELWAQRAPDLPLETPYEALILASIVEKETAVPDERPTIAGVFINRLRKGMKLQTDPTVIYGMGDAYDGNIRKADLKRDTPWNTYTRNGLPPTPISTAGREAIAAVLNPESTSALYFVASGGGRHAFTDTYAEHKKAVIKYQLGGNSSRYQGDK